MDLARLLLVTGKGGTGKSTVAGAMALALARRHPTTLVDLDQQMRAARMIGLIPGVEPDRGESDSEPTAVPNLETASVRPSAELAAFIDRIVPIKALARRMLQSRTFGYVSAALPGLDAFLMLERLRAHAERAAEQDRYVVVDAPATGSALELLAVPSALKRIAPLGTLNRLATGVEEFIADASRFAVILTLTPQEFAIREAMETSDVLRGRMGVSVAAAALNRVPHRLFERAELAALEADPACARLARWHDGAEGQAARARRLALRAGLELVELPMLFRPTLGRPELETLAAALEGRLVPAGPGRAAAQAPVAAGATKHGRAARAHASSPPFRDRHGAAARKPH